MYLQKAEKYISLLKEILESSLDGDGVHLSEKERLALSFGVKIGLDDDPRDFRGNKQISMDLDSDGISPVPRGFQTLKIEDQRDEDSDF